MSVVNTVSVRVNRYTRCFTSKARACVIVTVVKTITKVRKRVVRLRIILRYFNIYLTTRFDVINILIKPFSKLTFSIFTTLGKRLCTSDISCT